MALLASNLLPASYRGAPFAVLADELGGGRRVALHQYPGRDEPWAEDMGRAARTFRFRGFIVDNDVVFAGGPIQLQRALLLAALERSGPGLLIHPTLGAVQVSCPRFSMGADLGAGRMATIDVEFVESGARTFPSLLSNSSGLFTAANLVKVGLAADAVRAIALASADGGTRRQLSITAATWTSHAIALGNDATALHSLASQLPGPYGRFAGGGNVGVTGSRLGSASTIADLVSIASSSRASIRIATSTIAAAVASGALAYATDLPTAVTALVAALSAACADPSDTIRLLRDLAALIPARLEASTDMGMAFSRMMRRAVAAELAAAVGAYQPSSSDDAAAMIALVAELLEEIATEAADAGEDDSFKAVRAVRAEVVKDLRRRGSTLASVTTFRTITALPSLTLAQRFYRDATRADQIERQVAAPHPLFMPTSFRALAA